MNTISRHTPFPSVLRGDYPHRRRDEICATLCRLRAAGERVFDGRRARNAYRRLPSTVTVWRGTTMAELTSGEFGFCWSLERRVAIGFAMRAEITRLASRDCPDVARQLVGDDFASDSVVLTATLDRADIVGVRFAEGECEVLVLPDRLREVMPAPEDTPLSLDELDPSLQEMTYETVRCQ